MAAISFRELDGQCIKCGGEMIGDGYTAVAHCENAEEEDYEYHEPDAGPIYCHFEELPCLTPTLE